ARRGRKADRARPHRPAAPHFRAGKGVVLKTHLGLPVSQIGAVAITVGSFDGVHLGHADVIRRTIAAASQSGAAPALITFEPHPRCVLDPANCPQSITTRQETLALFEGNALHSSDIRRLINIGDVHEANRLVGREYAMAGPVEAGDQVGRRLGFPTANIAVEPNKLIPALGAYAGRAISDGKEFVAAL